MKLTRLALTSALTLGLALAAPAAQAETIEMTVPLAGANEVPPNDATGSGTAEVTYDTDTMMLSWSVSYEGLTGPVTGAHIHGPADPGSNAGIVIGFEDVAQSPIEGSAELTAGQADDLMAGLYYVNVHTEQHPGGELRGQIVRTGEM